MTATSLRCEPALFSLLGRYGDVTGPFRACGVSPPFVGVPRGDETAEGFCGDDGAVAGPVLIAAAAAALVLAAAPLAVAPPRSVASPDEFRSRGETHSGAADESDGV